MQDESGKTDELREESKEEVSSDALKESSRRVWLAGLGALAAASDEGSRIFDRLVERGRAASAGFGRIEEAQSPEHYPQQWLEEVDQRMAGVLARLGVPTRDDVKVLERQIESLQTNIDDLERAETRVSSPAAPSEPTAFMGSDSLPGTSIKPPR